MIAMIIKTVVDAWRFAVAVIDDVRAARKDLARQYGSYIE